MVGKRVFRVVIFRGRSQLVAQCLEVDIAAQARTYDELLDRLRRAFEAEIGLSKERNVEPFRLLPPAPKKFFLVGGLRRAFREGTVASDSPPGRYS